MTEITGGAPAERQKLGERVYFNLLRAGASQLVLLGHLLTIGVLWTRGTELYYIQAYGVVLLIMISGYLIARSVRRRVNEGSFSFWTFMRDRFARIYTPLLPLIPAILLFDWIMISQVGSSWTQADHRPGTVAMTALMLEDNNFLRFLQEHTDIELFRRAVGSGNPLWAVALEWWLYVGFAATIAVALVWRSVRWKLVVIAFGAFGILSVGFSIYFGNWRPLGWFVTAGCGWFAFHLRNVPRWVWIAAMPTGIIMIAYSMMALHRGVYLPLTAVGSGLVIVAIYRAVPLAWLANFHKPVLFFSRYSYSLFLVHYPVIIYMNAHGFPVGWRFFIFGAIVSHFVALAWWVLFERHSDAVRVYLARIWPNLVAFVDRISRWRPQVAEGEESHVAPEAPEDRLHEGAGSRALT